MRLIAFLFAILTLYPPQYASSLPPDKVIRVGAIYPLTGSLSYMGKELMNGSQLAAEWAEEELGVRIILKFEDSEYKPAKALTAFRKLRAVDNIQAVHIMGSPPSLAIKPLAVSSGVLYLAVSAAHADILKNNPLGIRHAASSPREAKKLSDIIGKRLPGRVAMLTSENDWAIGYQNYFKKNINNYERVSMTFDTHLPGETDFRSNLGRILAKSPKLLVVNSIGASSGLAIKQAREIGYAGPIYATMGLSISPDGIEIVRKAKLPNVFYMNLKAPSQEFKDLYQRRYGTEPKFYALWGYTDIELLARAVAKVGNEPTKLAKHIKGLGHFRAMYASINIEPSGDIIEPTVLELLE